MASNPYVAELQKPNALIAMRPTRGRLTTIARKVYNSILFQTQQALTDPDGDGQGADSFFEAPLRVLLVDASIDSNSGRTVENVKRYLEEMQMTQVDWLAISKADRLPSAPEATTGPDGEEVLADSSGLLYRTKVVRRDGVLWVKWRMPEEIVQALANKDNILWTRLQLQTIAKLGSYCAVALYEICSRYKTHVAGVTGRQSIEWWTDVLNRAPDGAERREWRKFKAEQLKPAIEEINSVTDIMIELIEHKKGRAVAEAQFSIKRRANSVEAAKAAPTVDLALYERGKRAGIGEESLSDLCRRFGEERVRVKLRELEIRLGAPDMQKISSPLGYFKTILRSGDAPSEVLSESEPNPEGVVHVVEDARRAHAERSVSTEERIKQEVDALGADDRAALVDRAMTKFLQSPVCTPLLRSRIETKSYAHPQLAAVIRNAYAEEKYGAAWREELI
jgi:predicted CopG family antitoxin